MSSMCPYGFEGSGGGEREGYFEVVVVVVAIEDGVGTFNCKG